MVSGLKWSNILTRIKVKRIEKSAFQQSLCFQWKVQFHLFDARVFFFSLKTISCLFVLSFFLIFLFKMYHGWLISIRSKACLFHGKHANYLLPSCLMLLGIQFTFLELIYANVYVVFFSLNCLFLFCSLLYVSLIRDFYKTTFMYIMYYIYLFV